MPKKTYIIIVDPNSPDYESAAVARPSAIQNPELIPGATEVKAESEAAAKMRAINIVNSQEAR